MDGGTTARAAAHRISPRWHHRVSQRLLPIASARVERAFVRFKDLSAAADRLTRPESVTVEERLT